MTDSGLNSFTGALLRSGRSGDYTPLGEVGQPVFKVAGQLREALKRKLGFIEGSSGPTYADHLALPKSDQLGDTIDWYSAHPGDVIPWSSATEDERESARQQLCVFQGKLNQYCAGFNARQAERGQQRQATPVSLDAQVFTKLLSKVLHTPDPEYVYLVNGFPVLTFWGFILPQAQLPSDPLLPLFPAAKINSPSAAVTAAPELLATGVTETYLIEKEIIKRPWWRRWLWLLPLLLLLLWLLFGLRYCSPQMANKLGLPDLSFTPPNVSLPNLPSLPSLPDMGLNGTQLPSADLPANSAQDPAAPDLPAEGVLPDGLEQPAAAEEPFAPPVPESEAEEPEMNSPDLPEEQPAEQPMPEPPLLPDAPELQSSNPDKGRRLQIPPAIPDGQADFLNGKWQAGAGIQDKNTGKPLRLEYEFNKGKGKVTVQGPDGIRCSGDVDAQMANGSMQINSTGQTNCSDGSRFEMPEISCAPGAQSAADCTGNYENTRFPMSMRNAQ